MTQSHDATDADHVLTLEEISNLAEQGDKPADTLLKVVALIATRFRTDVCSAYLLEPDRSNLVLAATLGLHPRCIGTLRMPLHEGLVGLVAEQVLPVAVNDARKHPRFKYFKESGEEDYRSFLGVPLIDRGILQGVLVVQTKDPRTFRDDEIRMLMEAANEVAPVVSEARTLDRFIRIGGEDHVGIGTDFDGFADPPYDLHDASQMPRLTQRLLSDGHSEERVKKILGGNAWRVLREGWGKKE